MTTPPRAAPSRPHTRRGTPARRRATLLVAAAAAMVGCVRVSEPIPPQKPVVAEAPSVRPDDAAEVRVSRLQMTTERLGAIANGRLQVPRVSPNGRWTAVLAVAGGSDLDLPDLLTGRAMQAAALRIRANDPAVLAATVVESGACWPAWTTDGHTLVAVYYPSAGPARLALVDAASGKRHDLEPGLARIACPAFAPDGSRIAVAGAEADHHRLNLFLVEPDGRKRAVLAERPGTRLLPMWVDTRSLIACELHAGDARAVFWTSADPAGAEVLARLPLDPATPEMLLVATAGIPNPLSPGHDRIALYIPSRDRVVITHLETGQQTDLPPGTRAGCWVGPDRFAVASSERVTLTRPGTDRSAQLLRGPGLPLWSGGEPTQIITAAPGTGPGTFELIRLIVASDL